MKKSVKMMSGLAVFAGLSFGSTVMAASEQFPYLYVYSGFGGALVKSAMLLKAAPGSGGVQVGNPKGGLPEKLNNTGDQNPLVAYNGANTGPVSVVLNYGIQPTSGSSLLCEVTVKTSDIGDKAQQAVATLTSGDPTCSMF